MSSIPNVVESGNVVSQGSSSAQERYFNYMLMKEKLKAGADVPEGRGRRIVASLSEKEEIEQQILDKLTGIKESSPEFSQVSEITGSTDKFEMARELASLVYDKTRAEQILSFYTPSQDALKEQFIRSQTSSAAGRVARLSSGVAGFGNGSVLELLASGLLGIKTPPPA
jgi:hypothetical protein